MRKRGIGFLLASGLTGSGDGWNVPLVGSWIQGARSRKYIIAYVIVVCSPIGESAREWANGPVRI